MIIKRNEDDKIIHAFIYSSDERPGPDATHW